MDTLDRLIQLAQIKGRIDVQCRFGGNWYVRHNHLNAQGLVHIVTGGSGWLLVDNETAPRLLQSGDVVFFPRLAAHTLSSRADGLNHSDTPSSGRNGIFTLKQSGNGQDLQLFCARFEYQPHSDLINGLPEMVMTHLPDDAVHPLTALLLAESGGKLAGSAAVVDSLAEVLLVLIMRSHLEHSSASLTGLLQGWQDKRLNRLIQAVLEDTQSQWPIERMAATAQLSRAQLIRVFKQQTGFSPHAFVTHIRLQHAAMLLRQTPDSVLSIALACGFQSETHFGKAFKKQYGITPGHYRKHGFNVQEAAISEYCI
ncbi:cupin domain-containing protein [Neisseria sp. CCUG12390]|uniref:cupin domain-containing protein n=1 Tax=Neisseria sp. CCUG12390 TaxID=3392035 RepID=UPI003A0FE486